MAEEDQIKCFKNVLREIETVSQKIGREKKTVQLVAVSKTYFDDSIEPILQAGHRVFGENRVQESQQKWPALKEKYPDIELRLIGPLQSNKTAEAVELFDVIETVDREKIARVLGAEISKQDKVIDVFVQVNTGLEPQKAGIAPEKTVAFVEKCRVEYGLTVVGLMCIPPVNENPGPHFALLRKLGRESGAEKLSMGMSSDFKTAIEFGATSVRVGSAIFGMRK